MTNGKFFISKVTLESFLIFLFVFVLTIIAGNIVYAFGRRFMDDKIKQRNAKLLARLAQYIIFGFGLYFGLYHILHLDISAFVASLGVLSVAVAFSSQQIILKPLEKALIPVRANKNKP